MGNSEVLPMMLFPNSNPYSGKMNKVKCFRNWMIDTATVLFDDNHNDLRALPKTVRLQLLVVLSFVCYALEQPSTCKTSTQAHL